jgi:predicted MPP superfamily phosphohydrolase
MRIMAFIIFFAIFFAVIGSISYYIYIRGLQSIPAESSLRNAYTVVFWTIALSFFGGRLFERFLPSVLSDLLIWMGSFWIGAMIYFLMAVALLDLLRLANHFLPFFPAVITKNYSQAKYITAASILGLVGLLLLAGHINSVMPRIKKLNLQVARKAAKLDSLNIVAVSDVHLGTIVGRSRLDHIVSEINSLDPDLVLMPGDIFDEDVTRVFKQNLGEALRNIRSRFGVYAVTGNHEQYGGADRACTYLTEHSITVLRDQSVKIADSFFLVGREDRSMMGRENRSMDRRDGRQRKSLSELMAAVDKNYPVILMDHQPFGLNEAVLQGVDLQISGHTHYGQLWPFNYIVRSIYEVPWGYKKIVNTHFYVSDGVGTWGPPVRIGNRPEIVQILLNFR